MSQLNCHKLLELMGTIGRTIVTLQLVGDSMRGEVSLQDANNFLASLVLKLVDFEVAGVVIYCAEVVSVFKMEDIASNCLPWTVWNLVRDKWFLLLIFLLSSTHITLYYVVPKVSIHARPIDCFMCMRRQPSTPIWATWSHLRILGLRRTGITHLKPLKRTSSCAVSSALTMK